MLQRWRAQLLMAQFDIHINLNPQSKKFAPYLVVLQNDYFDHFKTRLVAPLISPTAQALAPKTLNPEIVVQGKPLWLSVHEMAAVPVAALGAIVSSAANNRAEILGAIDFLISAV